MVHHAVVDMWMLTGNEHQFCREAPGRIALRTPQGIAQLNLRRQHWRSDGLVGAAKRSTSSGLETVGLRRPNPNPSVLRANQLTIPPIDHPIGSRAKSFSDPAFPNGVPAPSAHAGRTRPRHRSAWTPPTSPNRHSSGGFFRFPRRSRRGLHPRDAVPSGSADLWPFRSITGGCQSFTYHVNNVSDII